MSDFGDRGFFSFSWASAPVRAKRQLRLVLFLFFLALAGPLVVLFKRVYAQLEAEVLLQTSSAGEQLVKQINGRIEELLNPEESRSFDEYNFYKVDNLPLQQSKGLTFSPLSEFPPKASLPGIVGYFQVNPDGTLQSPILPKLETGIPVPQISPEDMARRVAAWDRLYQILAGPDEGQGNAPQTSSGAQLQAKQEAPTGAAASGEAKKLDELRGKDAAPKPVENESAKQALNAGEIAQVVLGNRAMNAQVPPEKLLEENPVLERAQKVKDLNLDSKYVMKQGEARQLAAPLSKAKSVSGGAIAESDLLDQRISRKERVDLAVASGSFEDLARNPEEPKPPSYLAEQNHPAPPAIPPAAPVAATAADTASGAAPYSGRPGGSGPPSPDASNESLPVLALQRRPTVKVLTLEGEVDPFQFKVLDKDNFLFVRKVWRDGRRYLQGFVLQGESVVQDLLVKPFQLSSLAQSSDLLVAYRGVYFRKIKGGGFEPVRHGTQNDLILFQKTLEPPLDKVELLFTAAELPPAPGAQVVNALAYAISLVIVCGLFGLYRLGVRQILFAKERSDFVSAVSHELKTPLTSIRMYSEMLRSDWVHDEQKKRSYYDYIFHESERLSRLIANVLQFARLSNTPSALDLKREPAKRLIELAKEKVRSQVEAAGFELVADYDDRRGDNGSERPPEVDIEEDAFLRIAINLVDNALKFSAKAEQKQIVLAVRVEPRQVIFSVRDFGPGIAKDQMKKIFQLFYRAEDEMNRNTPGTGIGLALVHELAAKMNASVDLRNAEPGAEFLLRLPLAEG